MSSAVVPAIVGALACQKDSYLKSLDTEVISCEKRTPAQPMGAGKSGKSRGLERAETEDGFDTWLIECADSVIFPEGGGQPSDYGSISDRDNPETRPIPVKYAQRVGLHCILHTSKPITPGTKIRQEIDEIRRWDQMQQHTGQHLLSAIMDTYGNLDTLGWGMGPSTDMNYVELPRKPSAEEIQSIQASCNEKIRENLRITVDTPKAEKSKTLPGDYDQDKGVVRIITIEGLDRNPCCGTHLRQTSHIALVLLHHTQPIRGTNTRLYFTTGDRAINMATSAISGLRSIGGQLSCAGDPQDVMTATKRLYESHGEARKKEKKLLLEIAQNQGQEARELLRREKNSWIYRADGTLEFVNAVAKEAAEALKQGGVVVAVTGDKGDSGIVLIVGVAQSVAEIVEQLKAIVPDIKGGGKGERWQGKVGEWKKGQVLDLQQMVEKSPFRRV